MEVSSTYKILKMPVMPSLVCASLGRLPGPPENTISYESIPQNAGPCKLFNFDQKVYRYAAT